MLQLFKKKKSDKIDPLPYYRQIVAHARQSKLYENFGVADTLDGRFEMLLLHMFLYQRKLGVLGETDLAQAITDLMFSDMDQSLREYGVGDISVAKKIRPMAEAYSGRMAAYGGVLDGEMATSLENVIARNVFPDEDNPSNVLKLSEYMRGLGDVLAKKSLSELTEETIHRTYRRTASEN
jgi:cytochrome b pre-mRNA-processing protein 3